MPGMLREGVYKCTLDSPAQRYVVYVRAWNNEEAAELFKCELQSDGVGEDGAVEVLPMERSPENPRNESWR